MNLKQFNKLHRDELFIELEKCCGSHTWIKGMINARPYPNNESIHQFCDKVWAKISKQDILQAFEHHPQIGDIESLKKKFASTANWAKNEQIGTAQTTNETLNALKQGNQEYLDKFGFIFIVCATGKTAQEMLDLLQQRLPNDEAIELHIGAAEQNKITHLRLEKMLES